MKKVIVAIVLFLNIFTTLIVPAFAQEVDGFIEYVPQYEFISTFVDEIALTTKDDSKSIIDKSNEVIWSTEYKSVSYKNSFYRVFTGTDIEVFDIQQRFICKYDGISSKGIVNNRISIVGEDLTQKLFDLSGNAVLTDSYDDIIYGNGDCVLLDVDDSIVVYDLTNQRNVIEGIEKCTSVDDNYVVCVKNGKYGIVDFNGGVLIDFKYSQISRELTSEYFYCVLDSTLDIYDSRFEKAGSIDISTFTSYKKLSEGLVCVKKSDGDFAYVDVNGNTVLENISIGYALTNCNPFYEGVAVVTTANGSTYINRAGELVTDRLWDGAYRFANGYALVYNNVYNETNDMTVKQWYIINNSFDVVKTLNYDVYVDPYYEASTDFSDGCIRTIDSDTGLMGFIYLENYSASSNNQLKLSPTSLYQIDRESQTLSEVFKDTTVKDLKNHFLNDTEMLSVIDADGNALSDDAYVVDGCKVQLISKSDGTTILDELTIQVSEKATETDPPTTDPDNPIDPDNPGTDPNKPDNDSDVMDFIDSIADKVGISSDKLLMIAGGSLAALVLLIIIIAAIRRRRY